MKDDKEKEKQEIEGRAKRKIKKRLLKLIKAQGLSGIPTASQLRDLPEGVTILGQFYYYKLSLNKLRKELGHPVFYRCGKYSLQDWNNLRREIEKNGFSSAVKHATRRFHGGVEAARQRLEKEQLEEKRKQLKEKRLEAEVLEAVQRKKSAWIKEIYDELKKKRFYKGLDALKIAEIIDELMKAGMLKYKNGMYTTQEDSL